ncbi:hypothetical protein EDC96DRAFT_573092 [Choanephora cucurbitarum]|nr:hypothetical protein EDC96DRAFT_573092 [Choanephora cucurbitarum]
MALLSAVSADTWSVDMQCLVDTQIILRHSNELGSQSIVWSQAQLEGGKELCSSDQVICVKDVTVKKNDCREVTIDFKVQYGNKWSNNINTVIYGVWSSAGYLSRMLSRADQSVLRRQLIGHSPPPDTCLTAEAQAILRSTTLATSSIEEPLTLLLHVAVHLPSF